MSEKRIEILDGWRGLALWLMLIYHLLFDMVTFGWMSWDTIVSGPLWLMERFIAWSFILLCGVSCRFSRHVWKRALLCAGAGLIVVAASFVVDTPILFGVLQFLSAAMLIYGAAGKWIDKLRSPVVPVMCLALYYVSKRWTEMTPVGTKWLFWLGFRYEGFESYDYFPVLPYIFLFLIGTWIGGWVKENRDKPLFSHSAPKLLTEPGRHTLLIYLAHQPVLYGLCWLASRLF